ncbi:MAG: FapA family protein [Lachnospiraceae bacterium]|nr:FapA family protein [Lachnospiraceae bacterium]
MQEDIVEAGNIVCNIQITVSDDENAAYICIAPPSEGTENTLDSVLKLAKDMGVVHGISTEVISNILDKNIYNRTLKFAQSTPAIDGKDGWYEFLFDTHIDTRPKILKDGSVDYSEYGSVPSVVEGERLVVYHPPTPCKDGINVFGASILAKKGKDLAKIKGKGFVIDSTGTEYTAKYDGKVTYIAERLVVDKELVVEGDVSFTTGDIEFQNDIHIRGNVFSGVSVTSQKGSIIVDGYVEQAALSARNDVVLKNGMQGNGKGSIEAGGSVKGKFFEQSSITCKGDVQANAIMNTRIEAGQDIIVSGKYGVIVGGSVSAMRYISANIIGNMSEVRTEVKAGVDGDLFALLAQCKQNKEDSEKSLKTVVDALEKVQQALSKGDNPELSKKRIQLMRSKIECDTRVNELTKREQEILDQMGKANLAKITINKVVNPGTAITINGVKVLVTEENHHVEYARRGAGIIVYNIGE